MKYLFLFLLLFPAWISAQVCTGNLGDNIFEAGDFGAGSANILLPDPAIAPDYEYSTSPPPFDGQYVITNNTAAWPGFFPSWLQIGDNSDDPNGYMMVVNASFSPGLFYDQLIDGLCENTLYEFSADVINLIRVGVADHIDPNVSFLLDDVVQFTTGNIAASDNWETFGFTFTTEPGQTSIRLSLRNNAPGGIGNDLALDNISFRTCGDDAFILPEEPANICEDGEPLTLFATVSGDLYDDPAIQWQVSPDGIDNWTDIPGANADTYLHTILNAGQYFYRFQLANGVNNLQNEKCRINSNVKVVIVLPKEYMITDTICTGLSYPVGNSLYTSSGNYVDSLINSIGCDSIVFTELTVVPAASIIPFFDISSPGCFDEASGQIGLTDITNGNPPYTFSWGNGLGDAQTIINLLGNTTYELTIIDNFGCQLDTSVLLPAPTVLSLDLGPDRAIELGDEIRLLANTNFTVSNYFWSSNSNEELPCSSSTDCSEINWLPTQDQLVYLNAEDLNGCDITDSVFISVTPIYELFIPNAFSPNLDGVNDSFSVYGKASRVQQVRSVQIFNRWGQLLHEKNDLALGDQGWDGRVEGKVADQGIYVYAVEVVFIDGLVQVFSGDVMLMR